MAELVLHFDPDGDRDAEAAAEALRAHAATLPEVASAEAEVDRSRTSVPDVLVALTVATTLLSNSAATIDAVRKAVRALKGLAEELGLRNARVEVGMAQVPVGELSDAQVEGALQAG